MTNHIVTCPICQSLCKLHFTLKYPVYRCVYCHLQLADGAGFNYSFESDLDEAQRVVGLKELRQSNFEIIIKQIKNFFGGATISGLEVGVGYGWFLNACKEQGVKCIGIEPEERFHSLYKKDLLEVRKGFYPVALEDCKDQFDFIIFNDVLEHIPDVHQVMAANKKLLKKDGLLIINLPLQGGIFIRLAELLYQLGIKSYLNRLWQFSFHSPHIFYFNKKNLNLLVRSYGFEPCGYFPMNTLDFSSVKERVKADSKNAGNAWVLSRLILLLRPLIAISQEDVGCFFFKKQ